MHPDGRMVVAAINTSCETCIVSQTSPNGGWGAWTTVTGPATGSNLPDLFADREGNLHVFVVGLSDGLAYHAWHDAPSDSWSWLWPIPGISIISD
jgi:hypothetical protein